MGGGTSYIRETPRARTPFCQKILRRDPRGPARCTAKQCYMTTFCSFSNLVSVKKMETMAAKIILTKQSNRYIEWIYVCGTNGYKKYIPYVAQTRNNYERRCTQNNWQWTLFITGRTRNDSIQSFTEDRSHDLILSCTKDRSIDLTKANLWNEVRKTVFSKNHSFRTNQRTFSRSFQYFFCKNVE